MSNIKINGKQRVIALLRDIMVGGIFLLVTFLLGASGHWDLVLPLYVIGILLGILLFTEHQLHRTEDSNRPQIFLGFFPRLFSRSGDPLRTREEYEQIGQEEDFRPFVFKDRPEDRRHE